MKQSLSEVKEEIYISTISWGLQYFSLDNIQSSEQKINKNIEDIGIKELNTRAYKIYH